jgi:exodeoxyribonuclease V beta subunit
LDGYRKGTQAVGEDADLHQIETEDRKVRIMTMHVAKGLEFPVVFVFGGLTQPSNIGNGFYVYHKICGNPPRPVKIFDLSKSPKGKEEFRNESESEDKRLYYVALTRARLKLYAPFYEFNKNYTWVGPVSRLLSPALIKAFGSEGKQDHNVQWLNGISPDDKQPVYHGTKNLVNPDIIAEQNKFPLIPQPFFPQPGQFINRIIEVASFSSLHHMAFGKKEPYVITNGFSATAGKTKEDDESFASNQRHLMEKPDGPNDIPGGTSTGSMFHDILENISFETVLKITSDERDKIHPLLLIPSTRELIERQMEIYQIDRRWKYLVCDVILNTLTTPISHLSETFVLAHLNQQDRLHEAEFYFPYPLNDHPSIPECHVCDGFIRGFIDLIFRYKDKFYIADWKSNILEEGYDHTFLEKSMTQANYHLQYKIYAVAALRWLKKTLGDAFDPGKNFGGVFYFYIRGMNGRNDDGIYYLSPGQIGPIEMLENNLLKFRS